MDNIDFIISYLKQKGLTVKSSKIPKVVFVGGIPGAGKDLLVEKTKLNFKNDDFNVIDVDLYRRYIDHANTIEETVDLCNRIETELFEFFIENKKNIIIVGTLRSFDYLDNIITNKIIPNGYKIYFNIIVTNRIESALSTFERYISDKLIKDLFPRLNKLEFLDITYKEFYQAMDYYSKKEYFKNNRLFIRGKNMGLPKELKYSNNICDAICDEEKRQISIIDSSNIKNRIENVYSKLTTKEEKQEFDLVCEKILNISR